MSSTTTSSSPDTIERILSLCPRVHIYSIPPLTSNKGHNAASWTADPARQIFTARLRVLESATPIIPSTSPSTTVNTNDSNNSNPSGGETITITILLEDPSTGALFAAAPYTASSVVEPAQDSSRFFAVRVVGEGGVTAMLGVGFEDRAEAVDFGICLAEGRKVLGFDAGGKEGVGKGAGAKGEKVRDWSLKEGETIRVDVGGRGTRGRRKEGGGNEDGDGRGSKGGDAKAALFSIKPPPPPPASTLSSSSSGGVASVPLLAPPPSAGEARAERRRSREVVMPPKKSEAEAAGFDDGEFGEFQ